jgi:hypothetical protein
VATQVPEVFKVKRVRTDGLELLEKRGLVVTMDKQERPPRRRLN